MTPVRHSLVGRLESRPSEPVAAASTILPGQRVPPAQRRINFRRLSVFHFWPKPFTLSRFVHLHLLAMLAVVILLLLLTALVATEPSTPGEGD